MKRSGSSGKMLTMALVGAAGLLLSACEEYYGPPPPPPPPPPSPQAIREHHVRWCYDHHGGYDPASNVYVAEDGSPHYCIAPWER